MTEHLNGWIKLHRSILNWEWFKDATTFQFFLYCLLKANIADGTWRNIPFKRGQFITSLESICKDTGLTVRQARTRIDRLISTGELTSHTTNKYRILTICKFEDYQTFLEVDDKQNASQTTSKRQANDKQEGYETTTGKEEEEDYKIRRERNKEKISYKDMKKKDDVFMAPTLIDVKKFILDNDLTGVSPEEFYQYYEECDWKQGKQKMKDWRKVIRQWNQRNKKYYSKQTSKISNNGIVRADYGIILSDEQERH